MAARALPFRALFILGLNEGTFPRVIREDAFLRDRDRRVLETDLGYKIPEKLKGYDEERLLFSLLVGAARDRLYLFSQRSDETGRSLEPSWYREELCRALGGGEAKHRERLVPRRARDKYRAAPFDRLVSLTPSEAALRAALEEDDPTPFIESEPAREILARSRLVIPVLDNARAPLGAHDGWVGPLTGFLADLRAEGFSATALEMYARCPAQFFLSRALGLEPFDAPEEHDGPGRDTWGSLCHEILAEVVRDWSLGESPSDRLARLDTVCGAVFAQYARTEPIGYPLVWELATTQIKAMLRGALGHDIEELAASGFVPAATEVRLVGTLESLAGVMIQGRVDRIDRRPDGGVRVIDYKLKLGRSSRSPDLVKAALQGRSLQPPLYAVLGAGYAARTADPVGARPNPGVDVALYVLTPGDDGPLIRLRYQPDAEAQSRIERTLEVLIDGIDQGRFPMRPDDECSWCGVASACRRRHRPSVLRAQRDERVQPLVALRNASLARAGVTS
jgi:ATP-dependent helicase/nuclease subunit B